MNTNELETVWAPRMLSILRIVAALIFMEHGTQKLFGFPPSDNPSPELFSLIGLAGVLELVGGILLVLGLFTRPVAFVLSGEMAFAYWMAHAPQSFFPAVNGGDAAILYCFVFLYLAAAGGGAWSLDNALRDRRHSYRRRPETARTEPLSGAPSGSAPAGRGSPRAPLRAARGSPR
jgi:putative oxidoreductase